MPDSLATECAADGTGAAWQFAFDFDQCSISQAEPGGKWFPDANGIKWYSYSIYLNYDNAIDASLGTGNLQQLDQVSVKIFEKKNRKKKIDNKILKRNITNNCVYFFI